MTFEGQVGVVVVVLVLVVLVVLVGGWGFVERLCTLEQLLTRMGSGHKRPLLGPKDFQIFLSPWRAGAGPSPWPPAHMGARDAHTHTHSCRSSGE